MALAAQTAAKPAADVLAAAHLFDYDAKRPFDIHAKVIEEFDGGTLHDVTYTSPNGGPVGAYVIVPYSSESLAERTEKAGVGATPSLS